MRVIQRGPELLEIKVLCTHCKSHLAYTEVDVRTQHEEWSHEEYVICPVCFHRVVIRHISEGC